MCRLGGGRDVHSRLKVISKVLSSGWNRNCECLRSRESLSINSDDVS